MTDTTNQPEHHAITVDLSKLKEIGLKGINRASGFLGLAFRRPDQPLPESAALVGTNTYHFLPDPLPPELAGELVREFNAWLVGNALQELDRHFTLFLDEVWRLLDLTDIHNTVVAGDFAPSEISQDTNAGKKFDKIAERLAVKEPQGPRLWSISNARNCLAHGAGRVRERDANFYKKQMKIAWTAMEVRLQQGENYTVFADEPVQAPDPSVEANVVMTMVEREKTFEIGEPLILTPRELHELCLFYLIVIDQVMEALGELFASKGIQNLPKD